MWARMRSILVQRSVGPPFAPWPVSSSTGTLTTRLLGNVPGERGDRRGLESDLPVAEPLLAMLLHFRVTSKSRPRMIFTLAMTCLQTKAAENSASSWRMMPWLPSTGLLSASCSHGREGAPSRWRTAAPYRAPNRWGITGTSWGFRGSSRTWRLGCGNPTAWPLSPSREAWRVTASLSSPWSTLTTLGSGNSPLPRRWRPCRAWSIQWAAAVALGGGVRSGSPSSATSLRCQSSWVATALATRDSWGTRSHNALMEPWFTPLKRRPSTHGSSAKPTPLPWGSRWTWMAPSKRWWWLKGSCFTWRSFDSLPPGCQAHQCWKQWRPCWRARSSGSREAKRRPTCAPCCGQRHIGGLMSAFLQRSISRESLSNMSSPT